MGYEQMIYNGVVAAVFAALVYSFRTLIAPVLKQYHISITADEVVHFVEQTMEANDGYDKFNHAFETLTQLLPFLREDELRIAIEAAVKRLRLVDLKVGTDTVDNQNFKAYVDTKAIDTDVQRAQIQYFGK